ncbi:MAG: glycogen-binding domain-containing protein [Thermodesulfobacteriota bacterium]
MACKSKTCQPGTGTSVNAKAGKTARKTVQSTEFTLVAPEASEVYLTGSFNEWKPTEHAMRKFKGGKFVKKLKLNPGTYEYQFIVDGQWWTDPANPKRQATAFGSENSVIEVGESVISHP